MEIAGHVLLGIIGFGLMVLAYVCIQRKGYDVGAPHVTMMLTSVFCLTVAFIPVKSVSIGSLKAEIDRQQKQVNLLNGVIESSGSPEQRVVMAALSSGARTEDGWANVAGAGSSPPPAASTSISVRRAHSTAVRHGGGGGGGGAPPPSAAAPGGSGGPPPTTSPAGAPPPGLIIPNQESFLRSITPGGSDVKGLIEDLSKRGLIEAKTVGGTVSIRAKG